MDIKQYQADRENDLRTFKAEYADLKEQYTVLLSDVINDSSKLSEVLDTNKHLSDLINEFIGKSGSKFDNQVIKDLTNDIIMYQNEYQQLKNSKKSSEDAERILNKESLNLNSLEFKFNLFLGIFLLCILFIIYLIFTVPKQSMLQSLILQPSSTI